MPPKQPKRQLTRMFPHKVILITSLVLCACATCTCVLSVLSWTNQLWGYYFRTGIWSGAVILITGILGIVSNYVQSIPAVKTFLISAIFGVLVSLALIALSAGGLDVDSGFYSGKQQNVFLNNICHGVSLGVGVLQLTLCILCDGICIYYLFIDNSQMYKLDNDSKLKLISQKKNTRSSTRSETVLVGNPAKPKSSKNSKKKQRSAAEDQGYEVEYRKSSRHLAVHSSSPNRSPCVRPSSFSTFGHTDGGDRASLIVHPGDTYSIADTNRSQTPNFTSNDECHYAQTPLFDPPLPIEEDEELPPYHVVDPYSSVSVSSQPSVNSKRPNRVPSKKENNKDQQTAMASASSRSEMEKPDSGFLKFTPQQSVGKKSQSLRHSLSADLLSMEGPSLMDQQGVSCRDFGQLSDKILIDNPVIKGRSNSFRTNRNKRLDRRRRALSAEIKVSKEHILEQGLGHRTSSIDGSNSGLFASNRIIPTKFSLRTPVRQVGMPHVRSAIPVKSVSTPPLISPPPKPPRTFSVKAKDFKVLQGKPEDLVDNVLAESNRSNIDKTNDKNQDVSTSSTIEIQKGPVLKFDKDKKAFKSHGEQETIGAISKTENVDSDIFQQTNADRAVIELSVSPTVKCPTESVQKPSDPSPIYAKVNKPKNNPGVTLVESQSYTKTSLNDRFQEETNESKTVGRHDETVEKQDISEDKNSESEKTIEKEKQPVKLSNEKEKHHNLQVRIPPLSPSERILRRKADLQSIGPVLDSFSRSRKADFVTSNNDSSKETMGARPKTVLQTRSKDNYVSPSPKPRKSVQDNSNVSASVSPRKKVSVQQMRNTSKTNGATSLSEKSKPQTQESNRHSISILNNVPIRPISGSQMSASSQGVLHLPQSQHNRQIQPARQANSAMPSHGDLAYRNPQDCDTDGVSALYAKLL